MDIRKIKPNLLDILLLITIIFSITGFILARAEKTSLNKVIEGKEDIGIEILIPDVFAPEEGKTKIIFKVGEKSAITIRNRPYTKLTIIKAEPKPKYVIVQDLSGSYRTAYDPSRTNVKDFVVTLKDTALKTKDGYVIGGNKIKIGNQVELEGFDYRLKGKVVNIFQIPKEPEIKEVKEEIELIEEENQVEDLVEDIDDDEGAPKDEAIEEGVKDQETQETQEVSETPASSNIESKETTKEKTLPEAQKSATP